MTRWLITAVLALACLAVSRPAQACSCFRPGPACAMAPIADAVFVGRVLSVTPGNPRDRIISSSTIRVAITERFQGVDPVAREVTLITPPEGGQCGRSFDIGAEYLFYGRKAGANLETNICDRTNRVERAAEDLAYLRGPFRNPPTLGRIVGIAERFDFTSGRDPAAQVRIVARDRDRDYSAVTDAAGRFGIDVPVGRYDVNAELGDPGLSPSYANVIRWDDRRITPIVSVNDARICAGIEIAIRPNGRVSGVVLDASANPIPDLGVEIVRTADFGDPNPASARTRADGTFEINKLSPGSYVLGLNTARGYAPSARLTPVWPLPVIVYPGVLGRAGGRTLLLGVGQQLKLDEPFRIPADVSMVPVRGMVRDASDRPIAGARVTLSYRASSTLTRPVGPPVVTDAEGRFKITAIEGGHYELMAETGDAGIVRSAVELITPTRTTVPVALTIRR